MNVIEQYAIGFGGGGHFGRWVWSPIVNVDNVYHEAGVEDVHERVI